MRGPQRLRTRIVWTTAGVSALAMAAMIGTVFLALSAVTRNSVDSTLKDRFSVIAAGVASNSGPTLALETPDDSIDDTTWLYGARGRKIDGPRAGDRVQDVADGLSRVTRRTELDQGERVFLAAPVTIGGTPSERGVLIVSESLKPYEETRTEVLIGLVLLGLLVTAGATGIAAWTASRTLDPVGSMADLADDWSAQQLDARFDEQTNDDEIAHLGRTLNVLLDRVAGALRSEQRLTSELAHELRTPLTAIRGEAELAQMGVPDDATRERLDRVVALADRMSGTITTLLDLARGDHALDGRSTTVAAVVAAAVEARPESDVEVVVATPTSADAQVRLAATTDLAVRALSPLLDNAVKHARSRVEVAWSVSARAVTLSVSDDGSGVPAGDPDDLFAAGVRRGDVAGAGLGLSLARRAARSLGGEVRLVSHHDPTTFTLSLPLA